MHPQNLVPPLPEVPEGADRDSMVVITVHVVSTKTDAWHVKRKFSEKRTVKLSRDYAVRLRGGNQWSARFEVPVWLYRRLRDQL